jgi:hypothetical protein
MPTGHLQSVPLHFFASRLKLLRRRTVRLETNVDWTFASLSVHFLPHLVESVDSSSAARTAAALDCRSVLLPLRFRRVVMKFCLFAGGMPSKWTEHGVAVGGVTW